MTKNTPVLRVTYFEEVDLNLFDVVEDALNRANINVEQFGGGSAFSNKRDGMLKGYTDFLIDSYENFDVDFCREVITTILPFKFELDVYENDPFYTKFV